MQNPRSICRRSCRENTSMSRVTMDDWEEVERWIEEELLDGDEREAYIEERDSRIKAKEEKNMDEQSTMPMEISEPGRSTPKRQRNKQLALYVEDELAAKVRQFCAEHQLLIGEFCRNAVEAALAAGEAKKDEPEAPTEVETVETHEKATRGLILDIARQIVCADRNDTYGSAEDNFGIIAELWKPYLKGRGIAADNLTSMDVAILMIQLKVARVATGKFKLDNFIDICGYAACGGECGGRHD